MPGPPPTTPPPSSSAAGDDSLLAAARKGDDGAFAILVERHDPMVRGLVHDLLDGAGVETVLLDTYVKAYRGLSRAEGRADTWLVDLAVATAGAEARRRERRRRGGPGRKPTATGSPEGPLAALRPPERAAVSLVRRSGLPVPDAAAALHTTPSRVDAMLTAGVEHAGDWPDRVAPADREFWGELGRRLLAARQAPAAPPPVVDAAPTVPKAPPVAMQRRAPRGARVERGEPDPVDTLATGARRRKAPRRPLRAAGRALAVVVVLGLATAGIVALVRIASRATSPVREGSVADVAGQVSEALDRDTFTATVRRRSWAGADVSTATYKLVRTGEGSFLLTGLDLERAVGFDAPTGVRTERTVVPTPDGALVAASMETGLAAGPPDPAADDVALPDAELGLALRALLTVDDRVADEVAVGGVEAWRLEAPLPGPIAADQPDRVELVVDRARLGPISLRFTDHGRPVRALDFTEVGFDVPAPGPFTVDLGAEQVTPVDHGFRAVAIDEVAGLVGAPAPRPGWLPTGFELDLVAVDAADGVVSIRYARGAEEITVSTRPSPVAAGARWPDPFGDDRPAAQDVALDGGTFRGVTAERLTVVGVVPSLWGTDGTTAFTVSGDLAADDLVRVAESLR